MKNSCDYCGTFTIKKANYCHHCGRSLRASSHNRFETALDAPGVDFDKPKYRVSSRLEQWQSVGIRYGAIYTASFIGFWAFDFDNAVGLAVFPAAAIMTIESVLPLISEWRRAAPPKPETAPQADTLRIEHVTQTRYGPQIKFEVDIDPRIKWKHIRMVFDLTAPPPLGEGKRFSKRNCKKIGISEGMYDLLAKFFRGGGYAEYIDGKPQLGYRFTRQGVVLLSTVANRPLPPN